MKKERSSKQEKLHQRQADPRDTQRTRQQIRDLLLPLLLFRIIDKPIHRLFILDCPRAFTLLLIRVLSSPWCG